MITPRNVLLLATALALGVVPTVAHAQVSSPRRDSAAAEMLFHAALEALDKGDWSVACTKFNASMDLDPAVATLINVAKCHEHEGKLAAAWADLNRALVLNRETAGPQRKKDLETYAKGLIAALEPRLSKLTIAVRERPADLEVTRDGVDVVAALGDALPVDPGAHDIEATAPGYTMEKRTVQLAAGQAVTVKLSLAKEVVSPRRVGAYVVGSVGIAGLVLGGVMGGVVLGKMGVIDDNCGKGGGFPNDPTGCNKTGLNAVSDATNPALASTISFGVGAAGVITAAVLMITERKRTSVASGGFHTGVLAAGHEGATFGIWGAW